MDENKSKKQEDWLVSAENARINEIKRKLDIENIEIKAVRQIDENNMQYLIYDKENGETWTVYYHVMLRDAEALEAESETLIKAERTKFLTAKQLKEFEEMKEKGQEHEALHYKSDNNDN